MAVDPQRAMPRAPCPSAPCPRVPCPRAQCPSAPCPPPGERRGLEDQRGQLFHELVRLLQVCQPKMFLFENVPGLARSRDEARAPMPRVLPLAPRSATDTRGAVVLFRYTNTFALRQLTTTS